MSVETTAIFGKAHKMNIEAFIKEFADHTGRMDNKRFCFLLGAGASKPSGISLGSELAMEWLKEIHVREADANEAFENWAIAENLGIPDFDLKNAANFYTRIFERRFEGQTDTGQFWLEQKFAKAIPSPGYYFLAQILDGLRHKVVVTTNFDNLAADAVLQLTGNLPRIISDARIARHLNPQPRLAIIAKVHGDIGFATTRNTTEGVAKLDEEWKEPLGSILRLYTPIVIGWEGNDGSLMDFLTTAMVDADGRSLLPAGIYWCHRPEKTWQERVADNPKLAALARVHAIRFITIDGFDEFLLRLAGSLGLPNPLLKLKEQQEQRLNVFGASLREEADRLDKTRSTTPHADKFRKKGSDDARALVEVFQAMQEKDIDKRLEQLRTVVETYPESARAHSEFAAELFQQKRADGEAETHFIESIRLSPNDVATLGNFANFLANQRDDFDRAEKYFKLALAADPNHATLLCNYASFLADKRQDLVQAERYFQKALAVDPDDATTLGNYALFLQSQRKDVDQADEYYRKALAADPNNANTLGNYALFLQKQRRGADRADEYYRKALSTDPNSATILGNYAVFLADQGSHSDQANAYFQKALVADPDNARLLGNYALFLTRQSKEDDRAVEFFQKAIAANPKGAINLCNYASFLADHRDFKQAEEYYQTALAADPDEAYVLCNYGSFLLFHRSPQKAREHLCRAALAACLREDIDAAVAILWMSGALRAAAREPTGAIVGALKTLVTAPDYASTWTSVTICASARQAISNPAEAAFWFTLGRVCAGVARPAMLDVFPQWVAAAPSSLETGLQAAAAA